MELINSFELTDINPSVILDRFLQVYANLNFLIAINAPDSLILNYINILAGYCGIVESNFQFDGLDRIKTRLLVEELRRSGGIMEL